MGLAFQLYDGMKQFSVGRQRKSNLRDAYQFKDRKRGSSTLVIVLAGYKQPLWPHVFPRLESAMPEGVDVCIMSAGKFDAQLDQLCEKNGWSYLATKTNDVSLVQNVAIFDSSGRHPDRQG